MGDATPSHVGQGVNPNLQVPKRRRTKKMVSMPSSSPRDFGHSSPKNQVNAATTNNNGGGSHLHDQNPKFNDGLDHLDSTQYIERFKKYEVEYTQHLLGKYFSTKGLNGGNIYDGETKVGDEIIRSSRVPCFKSYTNPVVGYEEQCSDGSTSPAKTQANIPNAKHMLKKN